MLVTTMGSSLGDKLNSGPRKSPQNTWFSLHPWFTVTLFRNRNFAIKSEKSRLQVFARALVQLHPARP